MTIQFIIVLFLVALISGSMMIEDHIKERRLNKKIKSIRIGQKYESKYDHGNPFKRGTDIIAVMDIKEGYVLYKDDVGTPYSLLARTFAKDYILVKDVENIDYIIGENMRIHGVL